MTDYRKHIDTLTRRLAALDERIAAHEAAAASTDQPLSKHFAEKVEDEQREHARIIKHLKQLRVEDATHWNQADPVAAGLLQGLLETCDRVGARIDAALTRRESKG